MSDDGTLVYDMRSCMMMMMMIMMMRIMMSILYRYHATLFSDGYFKGSRANVLRYYTMRLLSNAFACFRMASSLLFVKCT